jgi:signal transduction histidine kinase
MICGQSLHALTLFVAQLRDQMESSERSRLIDQIDAAVVAMNELFNALLDISKLDAGALHHYAAATRFCGRYARVETTAKPICRARQGRC